MTVEASSRTRATRAGLALLAAALFFAIFVSRFYAIHTWLVWRYAGYWILALAWALGCLSFGYEIAARTCVWLGKAEQLVVGFALGVLGYGLTTFALGLVHGLHPVTGVLLPLSFIAVGLRRLWRDGRRILRRTTPEPSRHLVLVSLPIWGLSLLALGTLYFQILSPEVFTFDARWYHLPLSQRYASSGSIGPIQEGFWPGAFPQLMSYLYTWVYLLPGLSLFDRMELGIHLEFVLFLATLVQIPLAVRRIAPGAPRWFAWCVRLTFPGLYLYDGNLNGGADHVAGFFGLPLLIAMFGAWRTFSWRRVALVGVLLSAIGLTKYTAYSLAASAAVFIVLRGVYLGAVERRATAWRALFVLCAVVLVGTAPHWLKNWLWYGDPLYPYLADYLAVPGWGPEFSARRAEMQAIQRSAPLTPLGIGQALAASVTFSFIPNDFEFLHRDVPVFGSLFTLSLSGLFFLRGTRRLLAVYLGTMLTVVLWYMLAHYDRYLQVAAPVMAAVTAACFGRVWQLGGLARVGVGALVALQVLWGSDVPFFRTHNQILDSPVRHVAAFIPSGYEQRPRRFELFAPLPDIGRATPEDAVLLMHSTLLSFGTERNWVTDLAQPVIRYAELRTPRAIHERLRGLGVTHLAWSDAGIAGDSIAGELSFLNYAVRYTEGKRRVDNYTLTELPVEPPPEAPSSGMVAFYACGIPFRTGFYPLESLGRRADGVPTPSRSLDPKGALRSKDANFVVVERACHPKLKLPSGFMLAETIGMTEYFVERPRPAR